MLPNKETFQITSSAGNRLYGVHWPADRPRALVLVVHGLGEHIERFGHLAARYGQAGIATAGFDHPGHGASGGRRGHAASLEALLNNVSAVLAELKKAHPNLPVFLHGQSMGGNIALHYALRFPDAVQGVIASSPWIQLAFPDPAVKVAVGRLMSRIVPAFSLPTGLDARKISRIPEVVEAYRRDPLVHDRISAGLGMAILDAARQLHDFSEAYPVPLLLMHGDADGLTSHAASLAFAGRAGGDITFRSWPGAYHELHNEPEQEAVFRFGLEWLDAHLPGQ